MNPFQYLRVSTPEDVNAVAAIMRPEDIDEVQAGMGHTPEEALMNGLIRSAPCYTMEVNGDLLGMWGVVPIDDMIGAIWMLGTIHIEKHQLTFLKNSKVMLELVNKQFPLLMNFVDARNEVHLKWLKWNGFTFINKHEKYGVKQLPFYEFIRVQQNV